MIRPLKKEAAKKALKGDLKGGKQLFDLDQSMKKLDKAEKRKAKEKKRRKAAEEGDIIGALW